MCTPHPRAADGEAAAEQAALLPLPAPTSAPTPEAPSRAVPGPKLPVIDGASYVAQGPGGSVLLR